MLSKLKILLLGGTGFLGLHLAKRLLNLGLHVRIFSLSANAIKCSHPNLELYQGNFLDGQELMGALADIDVIFHCIHTTIPSTSNHNPVHDVENNLIGSLNLFNKMFEIGIKRIVFISSGGTVYGNPTILPVPETHSINPLCSYGIVKVAIENYLNMFTLLHGFQTTILRIANPYGPYQNKIGVQGAIATFFQKIMNEEIITIWGDGSVVRDYIYINDVVDAMIRVLETNKLGIYNIGSGKGNSLKEAINTIEALVKKSAKIQFLPPRPFDVAETYLDITKANLELEWIPQFSLIQGCMHYLKWLRNSEK